jgi:phosphoribosyl-ATP pyrophosphohydrolase/phosphoribosyl-AMP cyclohydrolase
LPESYTEQLLEDRNLRLRKLGEEARALISACADGDLPRATEEVADLLYHALVALRAAGGSLSDVQRVLARRATPAVAVRPVRRDSPEKDKKK